MSTVKVGVANIGEKNLKLDDVSKWEPKEVLYAGDTVFFKHEDAYYSMKVMEFREIFKNKL